MNLFVANVAEEIVIIPKTFYLQEKKEILAFHLNLKLQVIQSHYLN